MHEIEHQRFDHAESGADPREDRKFNRGRGSMARLGTRRHDAASETVEGGLRAPRRSPEAARVL
jgi:hypothetical protein